MWKWKMRVVYALASKNIYSLELTCCCNKFYDDFLDEMLMFRIVKNNSNQLNREKLVPGMFLLLKALSFESETYKIFEFKT